MHMFENMMVPCHLMDQRTENSPMGIVTTYTEGAAIKAAIVKDSSMLARQAEKEGVTSVYTITVPESVPLPFHTVVRRDSDGATFRVTGDISDSKPPEMASFVFRQSSAERWEIPAR